MKGRSETKQGEEYMSKERNAMARLKHDDIGVHKAAE